MPSASLAQSSPQPPRAEKTHTVLKKHRDHRPDDYFWLKERDNPKVRAYLESENAYAEAVMKSTEALQKKLYEELRGRIKEQDDTAPYEYGGNFYFNRFEKGAEYPKLMRRKGSPTGSEELLVDVPTLARGHKFFDFSRMGVSPDQSHVAYAVDTVGRRLYNIHFLDLKSGKEYGPPLTKTTGNFVWLNDNETILYSQQDPDTLRSYRIFQYKIGAPEPKLIYEEKDPQFTVSLEKSLTRNEIYLACTSNTSTEVRISPADPKRLNFSILYKREKKHEYYVFDGEDRYYILTNFKAKNFRLVEVPKNKSARKNWKDVVPHRSEVFLEDVLVLKNHVVMQERSKGLTNLSYFSRANPKKRKTLAFPEPAYETSLGPNMEFGATTFRYDYQSLTSPPSAFDFHLESGKSSLIKAEEIPGYNHKEYVSERLWATAKDKTKIPISLVYKKTLYKKSKNPLHIYAYGSYGYSMPVYFRRNIISLLDRGFVFAIAHVRGGSDMGRAWYEGGKLLKKKNTFTDFISATEFLLRNGRGQKGRVYAMGGSAGGLLMGAILNMRPDLYKGVVAHVPFVDVLTTMLDDSIPLTTNEYEEWGNPNVKKYYDYMKSYSPYDNVRAQAYPNILIMTGLHDSQVQYWEPAKWVAKLRDFNTGKGIILLKTDMDAGHSGATGRFESLKEDALEYAFYLHLDGINQ